MSADEKRRRIVESAERLFSESNFGKTQISEIARGAGVGVGTFYRYFPDKDAVLAELLESFFDPLQKELAEIRLGIEKYSPLEQIASIRRTYEVVFRFILQRPKLALTFLRSGYGASTRITEFVWKRVDLLIRDMTADIERAQAAGLIRVPDQAALGHIIAGMVLQLAHKMIVEGTPDRDLAVDLCTRATMSMLLSFLSDENLEKLFPLYRMVIARPRPGQGEEADEAGGSPSGGRKAKSRADEA